MLMVDMNSDSVNGSKMFVKMPQKGNRTRCTSTPLYVGMVAIKKTHQLFGMWGEDSIWLQLYDGFLGIVVLHLKSFRWL